MSQPSSVFQRTEWGHHMKSLQFLSINYAFEDNI